jgi:transcriptional regulator with PAS, ATPase and Fis domain
MINWTENFDGAITLCDENFNITYMNKKSKITNETPETGALTGKNLLDCHNENSIKILNRIKDTKTQNVYTIEKKGVKKLIYQAPVFEGDAFKGLVELSLEIPFDMPHFKRD